MGIKKANRNGNRRGQITLFIIIGIVILFAFAFVFYIANSAVKKPKPGVTQTARIPSDVLPVQNYVSSCLDMVAKDGLELIGKQGGRIKISGKIGENYVIDGDGDKVAYWIVNSTWVGGKKSLGKNTYFSSPENYPWIGFPNSQDGYNIRRFSGVFGELKKIHLEKEKNGNSIQEQFENYIVSEVYSRCSNFGQFEAQGLTVDYTTPAAEATIGAEDVVVRLDYHLEIKKKSGEVVKINEFYSNPQIRLKKVYDFANKVAEMDVSGRSAENDDFRLSRQEETVDGYLIEARLLKAETGSDTVAIIEDKKTNYVFKFGIMNRKPAIKENKFSATVSLADIDNDKQKYAYDPDDLHQPNLNFETSEQSGNYFTKITVRDYNLNSYDYKTGVSVT